MASYSPSRQSYSYVYKTGDNLIDGVLSGYAWSGSKVTYSFPDQRSDYNYGPEKNRHFDDVSNAIEKAAKFTLDVGFGNSANDGFSVEGFTQLTIKEGSDKGATLRYAESAAANPTAYAYYPNGNSIGGDVWFGTSHNYSQAEAGTYNFVTVIHETGHALGLKHGHESEGGFPSLKKKYDSLEYSVMTYRSYVGAKPNQGYTNQNDSYPQSFMMADIAALQDMYGANYSVNDGATVYKWKPNSGDTFVDGKVAIDSSGNRIFATIWDGGGEDTYDLHLYSSNLKIDLRPGKFSVFKESQRADLDSFSHKESRIADGNIYNALMHDGNVQSLIENAEGGKGNDKIYGNQADNLLIGNAGNDTLMGFGGDDTLISGGGKDVFVFRAGWDVDTIADFKDGKDKIDLKSFDFDNAQDVRDLAVQDGDDLRLDFGNGDVLVIADFTLDQLDRSDLIL